MAAVAYIAWISTLLGFGLWTYLMSRYPVNRVAPFTLLVPVVGLTTGWVAFGEQLLPVHFAGAGALDGGAGGERVRRPTMVCRDGQAARSPVRPAVTHSASGSSVVESTLRSTMNERTCAPRQVEQLLCVQAVEALAVAGADEHEVVELARDHMAFHAAGDLGCGLLKGGERFGRGTVQHHANHHQHASPHGLGLSSATTPSISPSRLSRSTRRRQAGGLKCTFSASATLDSDGIALQLPQDGFVGAVQLCRDIDGLCILTFVAHIVHFSKF